MADPPHPLTGLEEPVEGLPLITRRQFLKAGVLAGVATGLPVRWRWTSPVVGASGATVVNPFNPLQLQNPATWADQLWNIAGYYAALLPFFFLAGLFISLSFVCNPTRIGPVYAADLAGAGAGAASILMLMYFVPAFHLLPYLLPPLAIVFVAALAWLLIGGRRREGEKYAGLRILR